MKDSTTLDTATSATAVAGTFLGVLPFPAHAFGFRPLLSPTARLPGPWWWVVSLAVCAVAAATLVALERSKRARVRG